MKQKINLRLIIVAIFAVILTMVSIILVCYSLFQEQVKKDLRITAGALAITDVSDFAKDEVVYDEKNLRITWIGTDGTVLYDNDVEEIAKKSRAKIKSMDIKSAGIADVVKNRAEEDANTVKLGSAVFDMKKASVIKDGKVMPLKAMEYKILVYLIRNSDRVIPKEEIFEKIWDTTVVGDVTLNVHIRHLREKIEDDGGDPRFIKTVWGVGFMLDTKGNP